MKWYWIVLITVGAMFIILCHDYLYSRFIMTNKHGMKITTTTTSQKNDDGSITGPGTYINAK